MSLPKPTFDASTTPPSSSKRTQSVLKSGERKLVFNVHTYFEQEREHGKSKFRLDAVTAKTSSATGLSENTVRGIVKKAPDFTTPGKKRRRTAGQKFHKIDNFDRSALRRIVHGFFQRKQQPTLSDIYERAIADSGFSYSKEYLRQLLHEIGFVYRRRKTDIALMERSDVVSLRRSYLRSIRSYRREGRNIVYLDETWVNQGYTRDRAWQDTGALSDPGAAKQDGLTVGMISKPSGLGRRLNFARWL